MTLEEALRQLKVGRKAKRLQSLWPTIEEKLAQGVSHAEILVLLNENGFALTERTYKSYLYRYRKRRRTTRQRRDQMSSTEQTKAQSAVVAQASSFNAPAEIDIHKRPPTFDYDPSGISPELLK
jgi:IS30 family transposase